MNSREHGSEVGSFRMLTIKWLVEVCGTKAGNDAVQHSVYRVFDGRGVRKSLCIPLAKETLASMYST